MSSKSVKQGVKKEKKKATQYISYRMLADRDKHILNQLHFDAVCIALNEVFHIGPKRIEAFSKCYMEALDEIATTMVDNDADVYMQRIDARLKPIIPEDKWLPWDKRYSFGGAK